MKKKINKNKEKIIQYYSLEERSKYINEIKVKLESVGLHLDASHLVYRGELTKYEYMKQYL